MSGARFTLHKTEPAQFHRGSIVSNGQVLRLKIEDRLVLLVVNHQVKGNFVYIGGEVRGPFSRFLQRWVGGRIRWSRLARNQGREQNNG